MEWLNRIKSKAALGRVAEEELYELAYEEVESGKRRPGLWAKAIAKSGGSEQKAKSLYIELLVQKYKDQSHLKVEAIRETIRDYAKDQAGSATEGEVEHNPSSKHQRREKPAHVSEAVMLILAAFIGLVSIFAIVALISGR